ncbi:class I SAM-dependent methyltransferase [Idiomarina sp. HP20-50]|uniref:class I SAM-dependent methyltransferase n=1 Tax=Idiomarina sp. HP20-50 TaxID=3070813 RepID=UPI00294AC079|nr:class I SAM-dependent methyltransferase [Idiomarina sp. HP20-50]MDV6317013.1 class I SAM-dependent methyltransferase [Idiomarina sp. HP20-50]
MKTIKNPWSNYWQKGVKASFLDERSRLQNYQMRKFWFERMDELTPKSPVVDIGTGNGIVVEWLSDYAAEKGKKLDITGIDSATLNPPNKRLTLLAETPYETFSLPKNKKVGTFVSHYGMEYGNLDVGLENLARQLKRGGSLVALVHSKESVIYRKSSEIDELLPSVIKHLKKSVYILQQALLTQTGRGMPKSAQEAEQRLNQFVRKHQQKQAFHAMNFVPATKHLLEAAAAGKKAESQKVFEDYLANVTEHRARLTTLFDATDSLGDISDITRRVEAAGFKEVKVQQVQFPETGIVGNCIQATKA